MLRNFNYTDRKRIPRENLNFEWVEGNNGEPASFRAALDLASMVNLRRDGQVWVEAYSGSNVSRYYFGTVERQVAPEDTLLSTFPRGLKPHFRVKVVDPEDPHKRLLAFADRIAPSERDEIESGRQSILPVEYVDLGQQVWNLRMDQYDPILQLNAMITEPVGIATLAHTPSFIALVYPAVIRQILSKLLLENANPEMVADHDWLRFGRNLISRESPDPERYDDNEEDFKKEAREWIDDVVNEFCRERLVKDGYINENMVNHRNV